MRTTRKTTDARLIALKDQHEAAIAVLIRAEKRLTRCWNAWQKARKKIVSIARRIIAREEELANPPQQEVNHDAR